MRPFKNHELTGVYFTCRWCGESKDTSQFSPDKMVKRGHRGECRVCSQTNRNSTNDKKAQIIREAKSVPCGRCGDSYPFYVMDLDHLPQFTKSFQLGKYMYHTLAEIEAEIAKCQVLCANCHRIVTYERANF